MNSATALNRLVELVNDEFCRRHNARIKFRGMRELKNGAMLEALSQAQGNINEAAKNLNISRATFYRWMNRARLR